VTFEGLVGGSRCTAVSNPLTTTEGFTFNAPIGSYGLSICNAGFLHNGSSYALYVDSVPSNLTIVEETGATFTLNGFDAGSRIDLNSFLTTGMTVTGTKSDLSTVQQPISFSGLSFGSFTLTGFTDLISANLVANATNSLSAFLIDNVDINVSAVPLPAGLPLMAGGVGLLSLFGRLRKRSAYGFS